MFLFSRKVRQAVCIFTISLAAADLAFPLVVVPIHFQYLISGTWQQGALSCQMRTFAYLVAASASILSYFCVTVGRYVRIIFPMRYTVTENMKCNFATLALLWLYSLSSSSFVFADFLDWSHTPLSRDSCSHALPKGLSISLFLVTYCVPLAVMLVIYSHILQISRKHRRQVSPVNEIPARNGLNKVKRITRAQPPKVFMLLFHFVVCWLPISVFTLVLKTYYDSELVWPQWTWYLHQVLNLLAFSTSVLNPFVYAYSNSHFKAVLRYYISRRFPPLAKVSPATIHSRASGAFFIQSQITLRTRPED